MKPIRQVPLRSPGTSDRGDAGVHAEIDRVNEWSTSDVHKLLHVRLDASLGSFKSDNEESNENPNAVIGDRRDCRWAHA